MKYLIVGLGNIGAQYEHTRHNVGFDCLDAFSQAYELEFKPDHFGQYAASRYRGRSLHFLKPDTYMNLSGNAVHYWVKKLNVPLNHLIVITDDLNLPFGTIRLKAKGSHGGHNGLRNIEEVLGTQAYPRVRVGIGSEFRTGEQVDFVLSHWHPNEATELPAMFLRIRKAIEELTFRGIGMAMNQLNTKS
ncbi:MAG: aminoacyl-tRNA hydrolase [Flavobacteriales bacterium]|nr:aminoacyl-tRNA hydrolase [Bacteroidota bacterium]MCB9240986.1 aminoacyl-tRNA hydrolase [Flavobacteriales bacterium]